MGYNFWWNYPKYSKKNRKEKEKRGEVRIFIAYFQNVGQFIRARGGGGGFPPLPLISEYARVQMLFKCSWTDWWTRKKGFVFVPAFHFSNFFTNRAQQLGLFLLLQDNPTGPVAKFLAKVTPQQVLRKT